MCVEEGERGGEECESGVCSGGIYLQLVRGRVAKDELAVVALLQLPS